MVRKRYIREEEIGPDQLEMADPFAFPGDDDDDLDCDPAERVVLQDLVRQVALFTLPGAPERVGESKRFRAGYIRWVALLYVTNQDLFASRTQDAVAESLGIAPCTLSKHIKALRERGIAWGSGSGGGSSPAAS